MFVSPLEGPSEGPSCHIASHSAALGDEAQLLFKVEAEEEAAVMSCEWEGVRFLVQLRASEKDRYEK